MPFIIRKISLAFIFLIMMLTSCVKDVDLDQAKDIVIPPKAALDLVFFTLTVEDFTGDQNNRLRASDFTRLDFLDDDYIQNNLVRADFNFRFSNTFEREFVAVIRLLSEGNGVQHEMLIPIPAGSKTSPASVDFGILLMKIKLQR